jgi:diketogulonate reductase-like aldo/keto reductase
MGDFDVVPAVNQVEWHPFVLQKSLLDFCKKEGIQFEAWSPLTRGKFLDNEVIQSIARKHEKTPAQVLIRWDLQHEVVTIPKSVHRERIEENSKVFDFELSSEDMQRLDALDTDTRIGPHPDEMSRA